MLLLHRMWLALSEVLLLLFLDWFWITHCSLPILFPAALPFHMDCALLNLVFAVFTLHVAHTLKNNAFDVYTLCYITLLCQTIYFNFLYESGSQLPKISFIYIEWGLHIAESFVFSFCIACWAHLVKSISDVFASYVTCTL